MAVKIIHAADFHMDSPFDSLPREKAVLRRREQREMLSRIASLANEENVQVVLLSGDLFDSALSYHETGEALVRALAEINARVFISPGNHDYYCEKSPYSYLEFPENVYIYKSPSVRCVELPELGCRVWGAAMCSPVCPSLLRGFSADDTASVDIMVMHGDMTGGEYNPIEEHDIESSKLDYLALGHVHSFSGVKRAGGTYYSYCGCPEGRGFDETGGKGIIMGKVDKGKCSLDFVRLGGREYRIIELDVTGRKDIESTVAEAVPKEFSRDICRIILTGEFDGRADTEKIAAACADRFFHVAVRDETRLPCDIWAAAGEDTLTGLFVSRMKAKYDTVSPNERHMVELAVRYGLSALEKREEWRP